jgi:hypothetical protein
MNKSNCTLLMKIFKKKVVDAFAYFLPGVVTDFHQTPSPSCDLGISDLRSDRTHCSYFT